MKKYILLTALVSALWIFAISAALPKKETRVFICKTSNEVKHWVEIYSKIGYSVKSVASQSIAVKNALHMPPNTIYSDLILILEK